MKKNEQHVTFPFCLDLSPFCSASSPVIFLKLFDNFVSIVKYTVRALKLQLCTHALYTLTQMHARVQAHAVMHTNTHARRATYNTETQ